MRVFIAIDLPEELKRKISEIYSEVRGVKGKFVEPENLHITLKFLGEQPPHIVNDVINLLSEINFEPFKVTLCGVGTFNNRVVWIGISDGFDRICSLHREIDSKLKTLEFEKDRNFHPHATILRIKHFTDKSSFDEFLEKYKEKVFGTFSVYEFKLKRSTLTPQGPIYTDLASFELR